MTDMQKKDHRKGTTKNNGRKDDFDRFYTNEIEALRLLSAMQVKYPDLFEDNVLFIEPSAGSGSFVKACEDLDLNVLAYDLVPAKETECFHKIKEQDFLKLSADKIQEDTASEYGRIFDKIVFIGNPPFGVQGDLSISFINHCYELGADKIWFILPPTFRKESYLDKLSHVVIEDVDDLENTAYTLPDGSEIDVPSAFIQFNMVDEKPAATPTKEYLDKLPFDFLSQKEAKKADFTIRRVGGNAGQASEKTDVSVQSNYFCRIKDDNELETVDIIEKINKLTFEEKDWTVGPRSISKRELAKTWCDNYFFAL